MRYLLLFSLLIFSLFAEEEVKISKSNDSNTSTVDAPSDEPVIMEDTSGLSDKAVRKKATDSDKATVDKVSLKDVFKATDSKGKVDVSKLQSWGEMSPTPVKYDWVQTKSGEWFKGEIKAMYDDKLEFDSDEIGVHTFKFKDINQIKSIILSI